LICIRQENKKNNDENKLSRQRKISRSGRRHRPCGGVGAHESFRCWPQAIGGDDGGGRRDPPGHPFTVEVTYKLAAVRFYKLTVAKFYTNFQRVSENQANDRK